MYKKHFSLSSISPKQSKEFLDSTVTLKPNIPPSLLLVHEDSDFGNEPISVSTLFFSINHGLSLCVFLQVHAEPFGKFLLDNSNAQKFILCLKRQAQSQLRGRHHRSTVDAVVKEFQSFYSLPDLLNMNFSSVIQNVFDRTPSCCCLYLPTRSLIRFEIEDLFTSTEYQFQFWRYFVRINRAGVTPFRLLCVSCNTPFHLC